MKRLFALSGLVAALTMSSFALASADLVPVDDPIAMSQTSDFVTDLIVQDSFDATFEVLNVAVDATISPLCRGDRAKDHANFCAAIANNKSLGVESSGPDACNPNSPLFTTPCEDE